MAVTGRGRWFDGWRDKYWGEPLLGVLHAVRATAQSPPKDAGPAVWLDWFLSEDTSSVTANCSLTDESDALVTAGTSQVQGACALTDAGDTLATQAVAADVVDEFARSDGPVGTGWTTQRGSVAISSQRVVGTTATTMNFTLRDETFADDQSARVRCAIVSGSSWRAVFVVLRGTDGNNSYYSAYEPNDGHLYIGKFVGGVNTEEDAGVVSVNAGDILYASIVGTTITTYINGTSVDSRTITGLSSGRTGCGVYSNDTTALDDFAAWGVASSGRTANCALADESDGLSAGGTVQVQASSSLVDAGDALSSDGTVLIQGAASLADAGDELSAAGAVSIQGAASLTDEVDALTAAGTVGAAAITADCALTDDADALATAGTVVVVGSSSLTDAGDSFSAAGAVLVVGDFGGLLLYDQFNRANENPLASPWSSVWGGWSPLKLTGNRIVGDSGYPGNVSQRSDVSAQSRGFVEFLHPNDWGYGYGGILLKESGSAWAFALSFEYTGEGVKCYIYAGDGGDLTGSGGFSDPLFAYGDGPHRLRAEWQATTEGLTVRFVVDGAFVCSMSSTIRVPQYPLYPGFWTDGGGEGADDFKAGGVGLDAADTLLSAGVAGETLLDCSLVDAGDALLSAGFVLVTADCSLLDENDTLGEPVVSRNGGSDGSRRRKKHFKGPVYRKTIETFQQARLRSGRTDGPLVVDPRQARAIAYSLEEKDNLKRKAQDDDDEMFNPYNQQR